MEFSFGMTELRTMQSGIQKQINLRFVVCSVTASWFTKHHFSLLWGSAGGACVRVLMHMCKHEFSRNVVLFYILLISIRQCNLFFSICWAYSCLYTERWKETRGEKDGEGHATKVPSRMQTEDIVVHGQHPNL